MPKVALVQGLKGRRRGASQISEYIRGDAPPGGRGQIQTSDAESDEDAIVQEREEDADQDLEPVGEEEEDELEEEVEEDNEERESERVEERESDMASSSSPIAKSHEESSGEK